MASNDVAQIAEMEPEIEPVKRKDGKATELNFRVCSVNMRVFHVTWMTFFMCFFGWFALPPLAPLIIDDLGITKDQFTTTNQASIGATIICRILIGVICDKFGARRTYSTLLAVCAIPVIFVGFVQSYTGLLICRLFIGCLGASFVITQYHTGQMFAPNVIGLANASSAGWGNFGGGVANAIMPQIASLMVIFGAEQLSSWRYASGVAGVFLVINSVLYYKLTVDTPLGNVNQRIAKEIEDSVKDLEDPKRDSNNDDIVDGEEIELSRRTSDHVVEDSAQRAAGAPVEAARPQGRQPTSFFGKIHQQLRSTPAYGVFTDYRVFILMLAYGCCFGVELIMLSQSALYFREVYGMDPREAGAVVLAFSAMNIFARSVGGFFSDRLAKKDLRFRVYWLGLCLCLEGCVIVLFSFVRDLVGLIFVIFLFGILTMICEGATFGIVPFVNPRSYGLVAGLTGAGGNTGAVAGLFLFQFGIPWEKSFLYLGIIVISVSLLVFWIRLPKQLYDAGKLDVHIEGESGKQYDTTSQISESRSERTDNESDQNI